MKKLILFLLGIPLILSLCGCPFGRGSGPDYPCPDYDTVYHKLNASKKQELIYKGYETLKFVDINKRDTVTFKGGPVIHGYDTIANTLNPGPEQYCDQIVIVEYYKIKFTNVNFAYEFFEAKITPKLASRYSKLFFPTLIIDASGEDYFLDLDHLCNTCFSIDSLLLNSKKYYKIYKVFLYGYTTGTILYWNKEYGVLNFPTGLIDNRNMVLHSSTK